MTTTQSPTNDSQQLHEPQQWTVGRVLAWVREDFTSKGIQSPRLEAELLLAHALGCSRIDLIIQRDRVLDQQQLTAYRKLVLRRRAAEPVAYLLGSKEFYGLCFRVDRRVLVPRPDTEILVDVALKRSEKACMYGRMLDLCTGSGAVVLAFAKHRRTWHTIGSDISEGALQVAKYNAMRLGLAWGSSFVQSDLFETLEGKGKFDIITANPPYINTSDMGELSEDIRHYEPHLALDGGADGLIFINKIVINAPNYLAEQGMLALEIGYDQAKPVTELMIRRGYQNVQVTKDLANRDRVVSGIVS